LPLGGDGHDVHTETLSPIALLSNVSGKAPYLVRFTTKDWIDRETPARLERRHRVEPVMARWLCETGVMPGR